MGWTYTKREKGISTKDFFSDRFNYSREDGTYGKVLECKSTPSEAYLAYEIKNDERPARVVALVCLTRYVKDEYNFGWKDMDEAMGPFYFNCPAAILDLLSPTDDETSLDWRAKCRANLEKDTRLVVGATLKFKEPVGFGGYGSASLFQCVDKKKSHFWAPELGIRVKLTKDLLKRREFTVN